MTQKQDTSVKVELEIAGPDGPIAISGQLGNIHQDPDKVRKLLDLLDLLGLPKGTEVRVTTRAASVIVR
jgi:hypothetical protein